MDELYDYLIQKRDKMYACCVTEITIDMDHLFKALQAVCFMRQIRNIVNFDQDVERMLERIKSGE